MKKLYILLFLSAFIINSSWAQCNLTVNPSPSTVCAGNGASINGSGANTYIWSPGGMTNSNVTVYPSTTTTYTVTGTDLSSNTCSATTTITVNPNPLVTPTATPPTICAGQTSSLSGTSTQPGTTYTWTPGTLSGTPVNVSPASTTNYTLKGTVTATGCTGTSTLTITVNPNPVITPTATPNTICPGATSVLSITSTVGGTTYFWVPGGLPGFPVYVTPSTTTTYSVTGTASGCTGASTVTVTVNPNPVLTPTATPSTICNGGYSVLGVSSTISPATYSWSPMSLGFPNVTPTTTTIYTVIGTATSTGCSGSATVTVTVNPTDNPSFHYASSVYCTSGVDPTVIITGGSTGTFTASPAGLIILNTATGLIDLSASSIGTYTITFTTNGLCPSYSTFSLSITSSPTATFNYAGPYCPGDADPSPTFGGGSSAGTFSSSPVGLVFLSTTTGQVDLSASTPGIYTVTNSIPAGLCPAVYATNTITINPAPTVIVPANIVVCNGTYIPASNFISNPAGGTFTWTNSNYLIGIGVSGTGDMPAFTATNTTSSPITATIKVTPTLNSCQGPPSSYTITVNPAPAISASASPSTMCAGQSTTMTATGGTSYLWMPTGQTGSPVTNHPAVTITYTVTETSSGYNCSTSVTVTVNPIPTITVTPTNPAMCAGGSVTLTAHGATTGYTWNPGGLIGTTVNVNSIMPTTYTVTGYSSGCSGTNTVTVTVNPNPIITISPINPTICPGTCVALTAVGGSTYMWYPPGLSGPTQLVCPAATTTYTVYITTSAGCTGTSTVTVTVSPPYTFSVAPADITLLPGQCTPLSIATAGTYIWTPSAGLSASTGANVTACPASTTTYSVTGTSTDGCTAAAQTTVHITDKYIHDVSGSTACHLPYLAIFTIADAFVLPSDTIQYQFAFGDGTDTTFSRIYASDPAPLASLSHAYMATGSYSPVAILQHTGGLADTIQAANLINLADTCGDISGKVFLDINHNCSADSGEYLMVNKLVKLYNSSHVLIQAQYTDAAGFYSFDVSGGTYTLAIDSSIYSSYSLYCPSGGSYAVSTLPATNKNFGADCLGGFDLYGHITGSTFHPGQNTNMYLTIGNNNCTPENAVAKFVPDPLTSFVTSSVSPSAIIGDTVCFAVNNLSSVNNPFKTIVVRMLTSASASVGDSLHFKLFIDPLTGDAVAANNTVIKKAIVTSSSKETLATSASGFNSKEVDPSGDITATTDLTYTIYFQNQGSATVANLFVLDTLDANLDLNTLQLIAASYSYTSQILTSGTRKIVKFLFANINLPDSSASPLLSNGFVTYQITPLSTAPQGTTISNKAGIYQDATPVIATNTVQNTIPLVTGESTKVISTPADRIYPNPASNTIIIELNNNTTTTASVYNLQGQLLMQQALTAPKTEMDIRSLPNGVYVIKLSSENGVTVKKFIKE